MHREMSPTHVQCVKTDWVSSIFEIRVGHLQGKLSVLEINLPGEYFLTGLFERGSYGMIGKMHF